METVPTIVLEGFSEDEIRAYVIADNKIAEKAGWDPKILAIELQHLVSIESTFDVTLTGFEMPEIEILFADGKKKPKDDPDDAFAAQDAVAPVTQPLTFGACKHAVHPAKCARRLSYATVLGPKRAKVGFTDPPYNVPIDGNAANIGGSGPVTYREFQMASGEMSEEEFTSFLTDALTLSTKSTAVTARCNSSSWTGATWVSC